MSNNTSPVVYDDVMPDVPETASKAPKAKKNVSYRVFAAILAAFCIGLFFAPPIAFADGSFVFGTFEESWFKQIMALIQSGDFGAISSSDPIMMISLVIVYATWALLIVGAILGIITIFCSKKAPAMLRVTAWIFTSAVALTSLWALGLNYVASGELVISDVAVLGLTVFGMILCLVLAVKRIGKKAWINALQYLFSLVAVAATLMVSVNEPFANGLASFGIGDLHEIIWLAIAEVMIANMVIAGIRVATEKGLVLDLIRYIVQILVAGLSLYFVIAFGNGFDLVMILAIVAAAVSVLQLVICIIQKSVAKKAKKAAVAAEEEAVVEESAPVEEEYVCEQYAEAVAYEGGPVEGVQLAEETVPTPVVEEQPAPEVQTAAYDYYNSRSFDPFIASLADKERNEFTEIFILKYRGNMPEIPDYQVGGDNKEFFRKIFIYLGQYRDRIPDGLLAKIYQFAVRM